MVSGIVRGQGKKGRETVGSHWRKGDRGRDVRDQRVPRAILASAASAAFAFCEPYAKSKARERSKRTGDLEAKAGDGYADRCRIGIPTSCYEGQPEQRLYGRAGREFHGALSALQ